MFTIRPYRSNNCTALTQLFFDTVHTINAKDYSKEQLDVWATGKVDIRSWDKSFLEHTTMVAYYNDEIVGFGNIDKTGYLDKLYVHKDYQRRGVATKIVLYLLKYSIYIGRDVFTTYASATAVPFFESIGFVTIRENYVNKNNILLKNYLMEYPIKPSIQGEYMPPDNVQEVISYS